MRSTYIGIASVLAVALLITGSMAGIASAATSDPMDKIRIEQGTTSEFGGGSYVAVNMTDGGNVAWFGVVYGSEGNPGPITLGGLNLRYLGGAQVANKEGTVLVDAVPIPILTAFAQQMFGIVEFNDTGYTVGVGNASQTWGANNGLFDFSTNKRIFANNDPTAKYEPIYKYVELKQAWKLSPVEIMNDKVNQTKHITFSLYVENVTYTKVYDPNFLFGPQWRNGTVEDGTVAKIAFMFHITASAKTVTAEVPFYSVKIDNNKVISSEQIQSRNYTGTATQTDFKYDHIVDGWDFVSSAPTERLMLENGIFYAVYIPKVVEQWYNAQFIKNNVEGAAGVMEYKDANGMQLANDPSQVPTKATLITKDGINFKDNWEKTGALTWVSNVTVDGQEKLMVYQIHAGDDAIAPVQEKKADGFAKLWVVLGGYIYPAGANIMHDPVLSLGSVQLDIGHGAAIVFVAIMAAIVICGACVTGVVLLRWSSRKRNQKNGGQVPPPFR
ncbi:MAG: hypothetical protein ABR986_08200 [Methanomassiliicoccales archaeon]|jgi:hypothetical protein